MKAGKIGLSIVAFALSAQMAAAEPERLKLAFWGSENEAIWQTALLPFANAVNATGKVKIELYPNGALGRAVTNHAQMVLDGVTDIAFVIPGSTPGRFPDNTVLEVPGMFQTIEQGSKVFTQLVGEGALRGYEDYKVIGAFITPGFTLHSRKPIKSIADISGQKIRSSTATNASALRALGAVPVQIAVNEAPEAIARGTVDGASQHLVPLHDYGYDRVTKFDYLLELGTSPIMILMNKKKYDSLSAEAKAAIDAASGNILIERFARMWGEKHLALLNKMKANPERTVTIPSTADLEQAKKLLEKVTAEWAAKSPRNQQLLERTRELASKQK